MVSDTPTTRKCPVFHTTSHQADNAPPSPDLLQRPQPRGSSFSFWGYNPEKDARSDFVKSLRSSYTGLYPHTSRHPQKSAALLERPPPRGQK